MREARRRLSELVDAAERGESVIITRRGRQVAQLGPIVPHGERGLPDLSEFRRRIRVRGKPMSETVVALREQERY
jgi:prevent-host-death family protein